MTDNSLLVQLAAVLPDPAEEAAQQAKDEELYQGYTNGYATRTLGRDFASALTWLPLDAPQDGAVYQACAGIDGALVSLIYTADEDGDERLEVLSHCGSCSHTRQEEVRGLAQLAGLLRQWGVLR